MQQIDEKYPQFISIDANIKTKYIDPLANTPISVFYQRELSEVYLMAAVFGFRFGMRKESQKSNGFRVYHTLQDKYKLLIRVIVLSSEDYDFDILQDGKKTLKIIEEYANSGAPLLFDKVMQNGANPSIESEILDILNDIQPRDKVDLDVNIASQ